MAEKALYINVSGSLASAATVYALPALDNGATWEEFAFHGDLDLEASTKARTNLAESPFIVMDESGSGITYNSGYMRTAGNTGCIDSGVVDATTVTLLAVLRAQGATFSGANTSPTVIGNYGARDGYTGSAGVSLCLSPQTNGDASTARLRGQMGVAASGTTITAHTFSATQQLGDVSIWRAVRLTAKSGSGLFATNYSTGEKSDSTSSGTATTPMVRNPTATFRLGGGRESNYDEGVELAFTGIIYGDPSDAAIKAVFQQVAVRLAQMSPPISLTVAA